MYPSYLGRGFFSFQKYLWHFAHTWSHYLGGNLAATFPILMVMHCTCTSTRVRMACVVLHQQGQVIATDIIWPQSLKYLLTGALKSLPTPALNNLFSPDRISYNFPHSSAACTLFSPNRLASLLYCSFNTSGILLP